MNSEPVKIQSLKYGNHRHYEWDTTLLERSDDYIFVLGHRGRKLKHYTKGQVFTVDHWTIEFFPFNDWFTVSADIVDGKIAQYYCNICEPSRMAGNVVSFIDLDIDLIYKNGTWEVVDEDEFEIHAVKFAYPSELMVRVRHELMSLQNRIEQNLFPFDGAIEKLIPAVIREERGDCSSSRHGPIAIPKKEQKLSKKHTRCFEP
ncbi:DUF402 domain-containing protein [Cohnella soli]|uniref:DUF402 domain-containing protein n=1 Tax=Cohnella soli TaxID=425005 RepID=A0ABW0HPH8_9BACL